MDAPAGKEASNRTLNRSEGQKQTPAQPEEEKPGVAPLRAGPVRLGGWPRSGPIILLPSAVPLKITAACVPPSPAPDCGAECAVSDFARRRHRMRRGRRYRSEIASPLRSAA